MKNKRPDKHCHRDKRSPIAQSARVSENMSRIKAKDTKPELLLRKTLFQAGIRGYRKNYKELPGKPDIVFLRKRIALFVHGCFWHGCEICGRRTPMHNSAYWVTKIDKNIARDKENKEKLQALGYTVIEIWEHQLKNELQVTVTEILQLLNNADTRIV